MASFRQLRGLCGGTFFQSQLRYATETIAPRGTFRDILGDAAWRTDTNAVRASAFDKTDACALVVHERVPPYLPSRCALARAKAQRAAMAMKECGKGFDFPRIRVAHRLSIRRPAPDHFSTRAFRLIGQSPTLLRSGHAAALLTVGTHELRPAAPDSMVFLPPFPRPHPRPAV